MEWIETFRAYVLSRVCGWVSGCILIELRMMYKICKQEEELIELNLFVRYSFDSKSPAL